jgi:predicted RNA binding protein YcfA (HicA-like mRNA interferase family)
MSKRRKRLDKLRRNPKNVTRQQLDVVLQDFGFSADFTAGSHTTYRHESGARVTVASHGSEVPAYIVKQALKAIDSLEENEDDDEEQDAKSEDMSDG